MKQIVKNFNNLIQKIIFKVKNKTNTNFQISNFNKYLITLISLLFFYLFYLSIPVLYDKIWVQNNIEKQLLKEFKINFSTSSNISYRILPSPHFLFKDSRIFKKDGDKIVPLAEIKNLRVFVGQGNFFDKKKIMLKYVKIDNANFSLLRNDLKLLKNISNNKFSNKKIKINNSSIFFKDNSNATISIIRISKALLFLDDKNLFNLFNLKGEVFNIPFILNYKKNFDSSNKENINIFANKLRLNISDTRNYVKNNPEEGKNTISFLNSTFSTVYKIEDSIVTFKSNKSKINNHKINYNGKLSINPFDLNLDINVANKLINLSSIKSILNELIKTELLFNDNIHINTSIIVDPYSKKKIFNKVKINFSIINGKINFDKTRLINEKIGSLELKNSNLSFVTDRLILTTDIIIDINNSDELFSLLQTNKKFRKPIKNIVISLNYDFLTDQIKFANFRIDNKEANNELSIIIQDFHDNNFNNFNKSKRLLNALFESYEG